MSCHHNMPRLPTNNKVMISVMSSHVNYHAVLFPLLPRNEIKNYLTITITKLQYSARYQSHDLRTTSFSRGSCGYLPKQQNNRVRLLFIDQEGIPPSTSSRYYIIMLIVRMVQLTSNDLQPLKKSFKQTRNLRKQEIRGCYKCRVGPVCLVSRQL